MLKKISKYGFAVLFLFILAPAIAAQSNMYYALSTGIYYPALPAEGYSGSYNTGNIPYEAESPAKAATAANRYEDGTRATAVRLDDRTEFLVYERRYYKRLYVEEPVYELKTEVTPPVSSVNKVMIAPHGYVGYQREFTENYVMPDFRTDVWLEKRTYLAAKCRS